MRNCFAVVALIGSFATSVALANDTSIAGITVKDLNTNAKEGTHFNFGGAEAVKFMQMLPKVHTTGGPVLANHRRALLVKTDKSMVYLRCTDIDGELTHEPAMAIDPKKVQCAISFEELNTDMSDTLPFEVPQYR